MALDRRWVRHSVDGARWPECCFQRIEISATITEAIADTLENAKDLPQEVSSVAQRDIAGAGFEPATFGL